MQMCCYINLKSHRLLQVNILGKMGSTGKKMFGNPCSRGKQNLSLFANFPVIWNKFIMQVIVIVYDLCIQTVKTITENE